MVSRRGAARRSHHWPLAAATVMATVAALSVMALRPNSAHGDDGGRRVSENRRLGEDPAAVRGRDQPGLAVDPADARHIVEVDQDFIDGHCDYRTSFDGGASWTGGHLPPAPGTSGAACPAIVGTRFNGSVAFGSAGGVYVAYAPRSTSDEALGPETVVLAVSNDGGRTFPRAVVVPFFRPGDTAVAYPKVAVEPVSPGKDVVHVVADVYSTGYTVVAVTSTDGGQSFAPPVPVSEPGVAFGSSAPAVGPDGTVHLAYFRMISVGLDSLMSGTSKDRGRTWARSTIRPVWSSPRVSNIIQPRLAVDPADGSVYAVYDAAARAYDGNGNIFLQRSVDEGATWTEPVQVNDDVGRADQLAPSVAVGRGGRVDIVWFDRRHSYKGTPLEDVYYAAWHPGQPKPSANRRITDRSNNRDVGLTPRIGTWPPASAQLSDRVLIAWGDAREGNADSGSQDIYLADLLLESSGPPPVRALTESADDLAVELSRLAYPGGSETVGGEPVGTVVVAPAQDVGVAVAGTVLARAGFAPIFVSTGAGLSDTTASEITRLRPVGAVIVGTPDAEADVIEEDLVDAGVSRNGISRLAGADSADTARVIARALDQRSGTDRQARTPAFDAVVVANPASPEVTVATALAAALQMPFLFVNRDEIPPATSEAVSDLAIQRTLVIGGHEAVGEDVMRRLPGPVRLGGADKFTTSAAVVAEAERRGLPVNIGYAAASGEPISELLLGAATARLGGVFALIPEAADARSELPVLVSRTVDRIVMVVPPRVETSGGDTRGAAGAMHGGGRQGRGGLPSTGGTSSGLPLIAIGLALAARRFAMKMTSRAAHPRASG